MSRLGKIHLNHQLQVRTRVLLVLLSFYFFFVNCSLGQVVRYDTKIEVINGKKVTEKWLRIRIPDKEHNSLANIAIQHTAQQEFSLSYARIYDGSDQSVRQLKRKDIVTKSDRSYGTFFQDGLIEEFNLYWNKYPYEIEYSYSLSEKEFVNIAFWTPYVRNGLSTLNSSLELTVPRDYGIQFDYSEILSFTESNSENSKTYLWTSPLFLSPRAETYSPDIKGRIPSVHIIPSHFSYGVDGSSKTWIDFGNWYNQLNQDLTSLPIDEQRAVDYLISEITSPSEKVALLYSYLKKNTQYVNVAIDVGGLKSYPASYVSHNKYGDCKALTTYMKGLLKYAGIESYYVLVNAGDQYQPVNTDLPSQQFNHVILMVPIDNDTIWLENTANYLPAGYLGSFTQGRKGLIVKKDDSQLLDIPSLHIDDVLVERAYDFQPDKDGTGQVELEMNLRGELFEEIKYITENLDPSDLKKWISKSSLIESLSVNETEFYEKEPDLNLITSTTNGLITEPWRVVSQMSVIDPPSIQVPKFEKPSERTLEVVINCPLAETNISRYALPFIDPERITLPNSFKLVSDYGEYNIDYFIDGTLIEITEKFKLFKGIHSKEEYSSLYEFIEAIHQHQQKSKVIIKL